MKLPRIALVVGCLAFLLFAVAGPGSRFGLWQFGTGFKMMQWGVYLGAAGCLATLVAAAVTRPFGAAAPTLLGALLLAGIPVAVPLLMLSQAKKVPPIHDITTDTEDPPAFVSVLPLRANALNPATYGGAEVAAAQRKGYPDLGPLDLDAAPPAAFTRALAAARRMGWDIVAADSAAGRIEATATTTWFGFKDDVVVRIKPTQTGSRIDVRSESRVGGSDIGTNAKRIRRYLSELKS